MSHNGGTPAIDVWERQPGESDESFEAFETYRTMGLSRSLAKAAAKLGKNVKLIERWNQRDEWRRRVLDFDRHTGRETNRLLLAGSAAARERIAVQAQNFQAHSAKRILKMTEAEVLALSPMQALAFYKISAEMEMKARNVELDEAETEPFLVVINVLSHKDQTDALNEVANRPADEPDLEPDVDLADQPEPEKPMNVF